MNSPVEVANLESGAPPPVGQLVWQSPEIQRLVKLPLVLKKLVVVAEVVVELTAMKFWRVDEAVVIILVIVDTPPFESKDTLPSVLRIPLSSRYKEPAPI